MVSISAVLEESRFGGQCAVHRAAEQVSADCSKKRSADTGIVLDAGMKRRIAHHRRQPACNIITRRG